MELIYNITQSDVEESLLCVNWKREGTFKYINIGVLSLIVIYSFGLYMHDTAKIFAIQISFLAIILLFLVTYAPILGRKFKASKIANSGGLYKVSLTDDNIDCIFESENVYTIQKRNGMYCIPKNAINEEVESFIKSLINEHENDFIKVNIRR